LIREQPVASLFLLYAACFLGGAVTNDMLSLADAAMPDHGFLYLLSFVIALPLWRMLRRSVQQTIATVESGETSQEHSVGIERQSSFAIKKAPDTFSDKL
jgi:hypothetical protein